MDPSKRTQEALLGELVPLCWFLGWEEARNTELRTRGRWPGPKGSAPASCSVNGKQLSGRLLASCLVLVGFSA